MDAPHPLENHLFLIFPGERNHSVKEGRRGSGGSHGKTLKRNLYPLNCIGSLPKITIQRVWWLIGITSMTALQGFGEGTSRPSLVKYHPIIEGLQEN